nr:hypothetical protein [Tanacetum cinerariifolium]
MSFSKRPGKNTPQCYSKPLDSLKNWNNLFFWVDECVFPPAVEWRTSASKDGMPTSGTYSVEAVRVLDTHRTPIQKQPEALLCLETAAPEVPLPEEVPVTAVPGGDQAAPVVVEPPPVQESRKRRREGIDANAPPKSLRRDHADLQPSGS